MRSEGNYIPSYIALRGSAKVRKAARDLGVSRPQVIGHLHLLWWWTAEQAADGDVSRFDAEDLAFAAEWEGDPDLFVATLHTRGFLEDTLDGRLVIHDWYDGGGKLTIAKRDAAFANHERWHTQRGKPNPACAFCQGSPPVSDTTAGSSPAVRGESASHPPGLRSESREEKRREEKKNLTTSPPAARSEPYSADFERFWAAYPSTQSKRSAWLKWKAAIRRAPVEVIIAGAERYRDDPNRDPSKTKYAEGWLAGDRWLDEPLPDPTEMRSVRHADRAAEILRGAMSHDQDASRSDLRPAERSLPA